MSKATSEATGSNSGKSATKELWIDTFYFSFSLNSLNESNNFSRTMTETAKYVNIYFEFQVQKISDLQFKIICARYPILDSIPDGDYKIQFYCDIFDGDSKMFEMQSAETVAEVDFSLNENGQDLPLRDFENVYDVKIFVKMIEYDMVFTKHNILQRDLFRKENKKIFSNESVVRNWRKILKVPRLEDIFTGRQNLDYVKKRSSFIQRASQYTEWIVAYMKCKKEPTRAPFTDTEKMLKCILQGRSGSLSDSDLLNVYNKAHYLGLDFLIQLSQDCFFHRLAEYQMMSFQKYEDCMFDVINAASGVNDEKFFDEVLARLNMTKPFFDSAPLWKRLESFSTSSKFAGHFAQKRLEKINAEEKESSSSSGEASTSNV